MSNCTFLLIQDNKSKLVNMHYTLIKDIIDGNLTFNETLSSDLNDISQPAFIVDFNKKVIYETDFNTYIGKEHICDLNGWKWEKQEHKITLNELKNTFPNAIIIDNNNKSVILIHNDTIKGFGKKHYELIIKSIDWDRLYKMECD